MSETAPYESLVTRVRTLVVEMMDIAKEGFIEVTDIDGNHSNIATLQMLPSWKTMCSELALLGFTLNNPRYIPDGHPLDNVYHFNCEFALVEPNVA